MNSEKGPVLERIRSLGLLAVIRGPSAGPTLKAVHALVRGGVLGIEITYSTPEAPAVVRTLKEKYGEDILLGMGTLTRPSDAADALAAGAQPVEARDVEGLADHVESQRRRGVVRPTRDGQAAAVDRDRVAGRGLVRPPGDVHQQ